MKAAAAERLQQVIKDIAFKRAERMFVIRGGQNHQWGRGGNCAQNFKAVHSRGKESWLSRSRLLPAVKRASEA